LVEVKAGVEQDGVMTVQAPAAYTLTVGEVAAASGVASSAVRFYEQHGVIHAERTSGDQRRFDSSAACRIRVAKVAQRVGLTVREIAAIFDALPADPAPADWGRVAETLIREAEERTATLRTHLDEMRSGSRLCEL
jgi:MerR family redox-sensitive transcriptional activator SoxR